MTPEERPPSIGLPSPADPRPPADPSPESSPDPSSELPSDRLSSTPAERAAEPLADRSARLSALIRADIESTPERRITFARFMERALYEPELGYYRQPADRPTDAGDFLTAPETHPIFGWTIARRIERMWTELGEPCPFDLIEYGAGSGTLGL